MRTRRPRITPGASPGTLGPLEGPAPKLTLTLYNPDTLETRSLAQPDELTPYLQRDDVILWLDVSGLGDAAVLTRLGQILELHPLALEDVTSIPQRPKVELYDRYTFVVARLPEHRTAERDLSIEQISLFFNERLVITFQENYEDTFAPVRARLQRNLGLMRRSGPDYLAYAALDTAVDLYYPLLEHYGERIEALEDNLALKARRFQLAEVHAIRRNLLGARRTIWPLRDALNTMLRDEIPFLTANVRVYLRDVYDHTVQVLDMLETDRELAAGLVDLYLTSASNQMNEVIKVLTVITTIFIPLTFVVGVYGMNFDVMPELHWRYGYLAVWIVMVVIAGAQVLFFRALGWLGAGAPKKEGASRPALPRKPPTDGESSNQSNRGGS
ncbi:MAG TPA: magnesium/cobalt transporter CorA [Limnochordia bacterium]|nr:magnesium/cobalt transporter CorA [Limnochordia bacterium]